MSEKEKTTSEQTTSSKKSKLPDIHLSGKSGFFLLALIFLLAVLASKWIQFRGSTIADSMQLHRTVSVSVSVSETMEP